MKKKRYELGGLVFASPKETYGLIAIAIALLVCAGLGFVFVVGFMIGLVELIR